jgi:hypothetical protein
MGMTHGSGRGNRNRNGNQAILASRASLLRIFQKYTSDHLQALVLAAETLPNVDLTTAKLLMLEQLFFGLQKR